MRNDEYAKSSDATIQYDFWYSRDNNTDPPLKQTFVLCTRLFFFKP